MTKRQAKKYFTGSRARAERGRRIRLHTFDKAMRIWMRLWWRHHG